MRLAVIAVVLADQGSKALITPTFNGRFALGSAGAPVWASVAVMSVGILVIGVLALHWRARCCGDDRHRPVRVPGDGPIAETDVTTASLSRFNFKLLLHKSPATAQKRLECKKGWPHRHPFCAWGTGAHCGQSFGGTHAR